MINVTEAPPYFLVNIQSNANIRLANISDHYINLSDAYLRFGIKKASTLTNNNKHVNYKSHNSRLN